MYRRKITMKKILATSVLCLMLSGCVAGGSWNRPGTTEAQFRRDEAECRYQASAATPYGYGGSTAMLIGQGFARNDLIEQCLKLRGYYVK
jgi:hypothetical protein